LAIDMTTPVRGSIAKRRVRKQRNVKSLFAH